MKSNVARIIVYGAEYCHFCHKTKTLLKQANAHFTYIDSENQEAQQDLTTIQQNYNYHKVPMIFIDKKLIGGYSDLYKLVESQQIKLE